MLRIITQWLEAQAELKRITERTHDDTAIHKETTVREILRSVKEKAMRLYYTIHLSLTILP